MLRLTNLRVPLDMASGSLRPLLEKKLSLHSEELLSWRLVRRSVDARDKSDVHFVCTIDTVRKAAPGIPALPPAGCRCRPGRSVCGADTGARRCKSCTD